MMIIDTQMNNTAGIRFFERNGFDLQPNGSHVYFSKTVSTLASDVATPTVPVAPVPPTKADEPGQLQADGGSSKKDPERGRLQRSSGRAKSGARAVRSTHDA